MVGRDPPPVKPNCLIRHGKPGLFTRVVRDARPDLRCPGGDAQTARVSPARNTALATTLFLILIAAAVVALAFILRSRTHRRQRAVRELLDAADTLEARLRTARAEIQAVAGDDSNPVREAMQEMLRQRLWLQQHGATARLDELDSVRTSIDAARQRIDQQLDRIERARTPLH